MKPLFKGITLSLASLTLGAFMLTAVPPAQAKNQSHLPVSEQKIVNVAHRGASGYAPEHTLLSYQLGKEMKADYIELDLQMTKDGHLVSFHDTNVKRTGSVDKLVKDMTLEELKQLDVGTWFNNTYPEYANPSYVGLQVQTLEEIIEEFGLNTHYYIETKAQNAGNTTVEGMEEKLVQVLSHYKLIGPNARAGHVLLQSFSPASLKKLHALNPTLPLVQLGVVQPGQLAEVQQYAIGVGPNFKQIDANYVKQVRDMGLMIHPYTVNEKEDMRRLLEWGVNGMFTNYPDRLNEVIKEFKSKK
ncbi:glycerophosphodiester phosphodiesterase [Ammoniphilus sp. YIM 78166]|uniref:glycerophosphodiester phosphodiesterase n=1 Tax=Ammoniphilus sp. YIM 78166 TaxID=1644106 RepID=UPI0010700343|nr:glycerophosphodiester phosphodiesterase [Ammoniphilus sp. YIM 78166]